MKGPVKAAGCVVFRRTPRGPRYLVLRAFKNWDFPKGLVEPGEDPLTTARRETREETAWRFHPQALVGTYLWRSPIDGRSFLRFAFCGEADDHRPQQPLDKGIVRAVWLSQAELQAQAARLRSPLVMRCIDDYLLGKRQPLDSVACLDLETALYAPSVVNL